MLFICEKNIDPFVRVQHLIILEGAKVTACYIFLPINILLAVWAFQWESKLPYIQVIQHENCLQ